ncbi:LuxR C-terminal-related transcriptional regulator [Streptomyces mirabilis]|uniref:helix-turn-helix transcriptional regulator n=1 Tax=Streptomyces mirabilis TaxID=68239 RepID=UPI003F4D5195
MGFSFLYDIAAAGADASKAPLDLIDPKWKGKIASSYPHDDAVLYLYSLYAQKYGWDWVAALARRDVWNTTAGQRRGSGPSGGPVDPGPRADGSAVRRTGSGDRRRRGGPSARRPGARCGGDAVNPEQDLSHREIEVVRLLAEGSSNRAIAEALYLSEATVKTHLARVHRKLRVDNRAATVRRGLLELT